MPVKAHDASEYLRTPEDVAAYLNAAVEESDGDPRLLMKAFRNVTAAQGGVSAIARRADGGSGGPVPWPVGKPGPPVGDGDEGRRGLRRDAAVRRAGVRALNDGRAAVR